MEATHRYRLLFYFVALVLCLSACFAYAEEPAATDAHKPARLLFQTSGPRSAFMPHLEQSLVPTAKSTEMGSTVSAAKFDQISTCLRKSHGLLHSITGDRHKTKLILANPHVNMHAARTESMKNASEYFIGNAQLQR